MTRKQKIQSLLSRLDALQPKELNESVQTLLREESESAKADRPSMKAIQQIADEVVKVKQDPRIQGLTKTITKARKENERRIEEVTGSFAEQVQSLLGELRQTEERGAKLTSSQIKGILDRLNEYQDSFEKERKGIENKNLLLEGEVSRIAQELKMMSPRLESAFRVNFQAQSSRIQTTNDSIVLVREDVTKVDAKIEELRKSLTRRIASFQGNGNMNRNIAVGGNSSTLNRYADVNLIAGSNVSISYANNDTSKFTDITLSATVPSGNPGLFASAAGTINAVNASFIYPSNPQAVIGDGIVYFEGNGYSYVASTISMDIPPSQYLQVMP